MERDAEFTAYVRERGPALTRTAFFLAGDRHLAEDLVQTALSHAYVHWPRVRDRDAYVRRALVNANAAWWRRRSASEVVTSDVPDSAWSDRTDAVLDREPLLAALRELPARQRAAVVLRYFEDLSEADTAAALGCTVGSVKRHTSRGLDRLRRILGAEHGIAVRPLVEPTW